MSTNPPAPNGSNPPDPTDPGANPPNDSVKDAEAVLAKNRELLAANAKLKADIDAFNKAKKDAEDAALKDQQKWKEVAENTEKENSELKAKLAQVDTQDKQRRKLAAVVNAVDGSTIDTKWWQLLQNEFLDDVQVDAEGAVDKGSVAKVVEKIRKEYPEIIRAKGGPTLPNGAPGAKGDATTIRRSEWLKLPSKEMSKWKPAQIVDG